MTQHSAKRCASHQIACISILFGTFSAVTAAKAQTAQDQMHQQRDAAQQQQNSIYQNHVLPQQQALANRVPNVPGQLNLFPREVRAPQNHGALAWYEKGPNRYGYIFVKGLMSPTSAGIQVDMECEKRHLTCEQKKLISNSWFAIGRYNDRVFFATSTGDTRSEAEDSVQNRCRTDGTTCTIIDAFEVMPNPRGISHQPLITVVR